MKLLYLNGDRNGSTVDLKPQGTRIGRETDNDIQLLTEGVSRYHAVISLGSDGNWVITDLNSTNGTTVNQVQIYVPTGLKDGTIIAFGNQLFRCVDDDGAQSEPMQTVLFRPKKGDSELKPQKTEEFSKPPSPTPVQPVFTQDVKIFGKKQSKKNGKGPLTENDRRKKRIGNLLFFLAVLIVAAIILFVFFVLNEDSHNGSAGQGTPKAVKIVNPLLLYYEKYSIQGTNVFKFTFRLENNRIEVTLDEPLNDRHFYELFREDVDKDLLKEFQNNLNDSRFMELQQDTLIGTTSDHKGYRRIIAGFDNKFNDISVSNDVSETFNRTEEIIQSFLSEFDLDVMSQSVDTILEEAATALYVAEEAYRNIETDPSNLPKAIANYKIAVQRYKQFDPIPDKGKQAIEGLETAASKLEQIRKDGSHNVNILVNQNRYDEAVKECERLMEIFPPDSETYRNIKDTKIKIEKKRSNTRSN